MLDECAPGHTRKTTKHNVRIMYNGQTYPRFPLGEHGKKRGTKKFDVKLGHVRNLARLFGIQDCARGHFPQL